MVRVDGAPSLLLVLHAGDAPVDVLLPAAFGDAAWDPVLDAWHARRRPGDYILPACEPLAVPAHTALVLRAVPS